MPLILSTVPLPHEKDLLDLNISVSYRKIVEEINTIIFNCNDKYNNIYLFDFLAWAAFFGGSAFDRKMDYFARQPISNKAIGSFANALARTIRPFVLPNIKVIALDLDNVLWGGAVSDDAINDVDTNSIRALNDKLYQDERIELSLVPIGDGLTLAMKRN